MENKQYKQAIELLSTLCKKGKMEREQIDKIINENDVDAICNYLETYQYLKAFRTEESGLFTILKTQKTCNGQSFLEEKIKNNTPQKRPKTILTRVWYSTKKFMIPVIATIVGGFLLYLLIEWYKTLSYV